MLFVGTSIIHPSTEGVFLLCNILDLLIYSYRKEMGAEPEMMHVEAVDREGLRRRVKDPFYQNTISILAMENDQVLGRIEYHFYGCMQDGYRMAYVDWVYVLPEARHKGVAQGLFQEMEKDCRKHGINQYYLIRATNPNADKFYHSFENAELDEESFLRKELKE